MEVDDPTCWKLKGQGRANAVFSYTGDNHQLAGQVLRVAKTRRQQDAAPLNNQAALDRLEEKIWDPVLSIEHFTDQAGRQAAYEDLVLRPLLGEQYIHKPSSQMALPQDFAASLSRQLSSDDSLSSTAWLLPDHTVIHPGFANRASPGLEAGSSESVSGQPKLSVQRTICAELKPKCGFLPTSQCIAPEHAFKKHISRFQLHQQLKKAQGKTMEVSEYDPLDLFSGVPEHMATALHALFANPQNNLRLFVEGAAAQLPPKEKLQSGWEPLQAFGGLQGLVRLLCGVLNRESVLGRILAVQKLDKHNIEGIFPLFQALAAQESQSDMLLDCQGADSRASCHKNPLHLGDASTPGTLLSEDGPVEQSSEKLLKDSLKPINEESSVKEMDQQCTSERSCQRTAITALLGLGVASACEALRDYLVAVTAKDCSIMITLQRLEGNGGSAAENGSEAGNSAQAGSLQNDPDMDGVLFDAKSAGMFKYKVAVVDLDLKPLWKIEEHFRLDQSIVRIAGMQAEASQANHPSH